MQFKLGLIGEEEFEKQGAELKKKKAS